MPHSDTHDDDDPHSLHSPAYFRDWFRVIERQWSPFLRPAAKTILYMVLDRTLGWGKEWERITVTQMVNGVKGRRDDSVVHPGTGLGKDAVREWLEALVSAGALLRDGQFLSLNFRWSPVPVDRLKTFQTQETPMLRHSTKVPPAPARRRLAQPRSEIGRNFRLNGAENPPDGAENPPYKRREKERGKQGETPGIRPERLGGELERNLARVETFHAEREAEGAKQVSLPSAEKLGTAWDRLVARLQPDAPSMSTRRTDAAILRKFAQRFMRVTEKKERRVPYQTFYGFMVWCIQHWGLLADNTFHWAKDFPQHPQVRTFVGLGDHFVKAWQVRQDVEARAQMTPREAMVHDLIRRGKDPETAERAAEEAYGQKEELARERAALRQKCTALALKEAEREKTQTRTAAATDLAERVKALPKSGAQFKPFSEE